MIHDTCRSVGISARYGLDCPGIEFRKCEIFSTKSDRPWGLPSLHYNGYLVFTRGKVSGMWCWPPTPSSGEVNGRVRL